jgi:hypothetical protein
LQNEARLVVPATDIEIGIYDSKTRRLLAKISETVENYTYLIFFILFLTAFAFFPGIFREAIALIKKLDPAPH